MKKSARFVVDTHVHPHGRAVGPALEKRMQGLGKSKDKADYNDLGSVLGSVEVYDNSDRLLYDMDCYGVDMCVLQPSFGSGNELNMKLIEKYPDRMKAMALPMKSLALGEAWTPQIAAKELDELLATGKFCGIGEGPISRPYSITQGKTYNMSERMDELRLTMDVGRKYKVPVTFHTGGAGGYPVAHTRWPENWHPYWLNDIAAEYPDVPVVFSHGGVQGGYMEDLIDQCIHVASNFDNVYLECGLYWSEVYYKALRYPNVGPEKLIWGTDWGAAIPFQTDIGNCPQSYCMQVRAQGLVKHQVDFMGWSLRQVDRLDISQDDVNLILGGNAIRLYKLDFPLTRMFRPRD